MAAWLIILVLLGLVIVPVLYINRIIVLSNRIDNAWSQIDVQLKKRADLVPNLVETVKGYMKHEKKAIEMVVKAREEMMKIGDDIKLREKVENQLADALKTIFALAENYPKLKASENFKMLQEQLESIENKIAYARQFYNDSVLEYNNLVTTIPGIWFVGLTGKPRTREYFQIGESERKPVKVEF
ncbi:MAG: LemA family protein [Candidatus Aenigmarchaeota archaeon]|nr:LemA family protein [Candidatus Aenigmarchaeota archaeon]MCX8179189.1 LemA family protein [Candidatus Aenigmarchaeota archaeon]MDW8149541.1 LemA family protein [Candidatus Aenigmarchaeota archaeon]